MRPILHPNSVLRSQTATDMVVQVDILHPAHLNFFKNVIKTLEMNDVDVVISVLDRGKVPKIVRKEFPDKEVHVIGRHRGTKFSIIFEANFRRFFQMFFLLLKHKPRIGLSVGSFIMGFGLQLLSRKNYQVDDDPERFFNVLLEKWTSSKLYFPPNVHADHPKVNNFNCLKEWAYLSPKYFRPDEEVLEEYGLPKNGYIFIREVSTGSLNYINEAKNPIASISHGFPENHPVLLSLEDKSTRDQYPSHWTILEEPVRDIHSLMYFSKCLISSGDSMAREGGMLGKPAVYCGGREMHANRLLIDKSMLLHLGIEETLRFVNRLAKGEVEWESQGTLRNQLLEEWDDINELLLRQLEEDLGIPLKNKARSIVSTVPKIN